MDIRLARILVTSPDESIRLDPGFQFRAWDGLRAIRLIKRFNRVQFTWIPRKNNRSADQLTRYAMHQLQLDQTTRKGTLRAMDRVAEDTLPSKPFPVMDIRVYQRQMATTI